MNYNDFKRAVLGKAFDIDGYYGAQCWDGGAKYLMYLGYPVIDCTVSGYAKDIWIYRRTNGILNFCNEVSVLQSGDIVIFKEVPNVTPFSHIAIFDSDIDGRYGWFLGQNQGGANGAFTLCKFPYSATYDTSFRPKCFVNQVQHNDYSESKLIDEHAYATLMYDIQKRRDTPNGIVAETLKKGAKLEYTQKYVGNGHRYISWVEHQANGASYRYFVAVNGNEQGTEPWATFTSIEEQKPTESITLTQEDGIATFTVDGVRARYDSPKGEVCKTYNANDSVRYYWKYVGNGHRYVVYKEGDRKVFVAVSATEDRTQMWATFTVPNTNTKEDTKDDSKPSKPTTDYKKNVKGYGVDVSEHNTDINVSKYDFVIIRACYGDNTDKKFESFVKACESAKIPYGVYCYDYAINDEQAKAEANYILDLIKDKNVQLGVWFDMEDADGYKKKNSVLTKERCTQSCKIFCDILKEKGYYTGVYTSTSWIGNYVDTDYPLWVANWGTNDGNIQSDQSSVGVMHQYTSNPLDKNVIYHDVSFYASNPIKEEIKKDDSNDTSDSNDKINVNGINQIINLILKILKKLSNLFK